MACSVVSAFADTTVPSKEVYRVEIESDRTFYYPLKGVERKYTLPSSLPEEVERMPYIYTFVILYGSGSDESIQLIASGSNTPNSSSLSLTQYKTDTGSPYFNFTTYGNGDEDYVYTFNPNYGWIKVSSSVTSFHLVTFVSSTSPLVSGGRLWVDSSTYAEGSVGKVTGWFFDGQEDSGYSASGDDVVEVIISSFKGAISGLASGVVPAFNAIALSDDGLSSLAIWSIVFVGIGIAVAIIWVIIRKVG